MDLYRRSSLQPRVLILDADAQRRADATAHLEQRGLTIVGHATDLDEARAAVRSDRPAVPTTQTPGPGF